MEHQSASHSALDLSTILIALTAGAGISIPVLLVAFGPAPATIHPGTAIPVLLGLLCAAALLADGEIRSWMHHYPWPCVLFTGVALVAPAAIVAISALAVQQGVAHWLVLALSVIGITVFRGAFRRTLATDPFWVLAPMALALLVAGVLLLLP